MKNLYTVTTFYDEDKNPPETVYYLAESIKDVMHETRHERNRGEWILESETDKNAVYRNSFYWLSFGQCKIEIEQQPVKDLTE